MWRTSPAALHRFQRINVTKLTTNGNAAFAAISRDGKYVAYVMNEGGQQSLWLRQVAVESNVRILPARSGHYLGIAFSPDSNYIYYGYVDSNQRPELYKVPVLGMGAAAMRINLYTGPQAVSLDLVADERLRAGGDALDRLGERGLVGAAAVGAAGLSGHGCAPATWPPRDRRVP